MAGLSFKHIYKVYPNGTKAVNDFNMEIEDKEFIVFVGPSGCGKSTTLRMIAGLEDISAGELAIGDMVVNDVEPKDRDIAMVFQNYALYPHMTVYENIAFGLRLRKLSKEEIHRRVTEAADILGITEYLAKKPKEMSGGQRQRVSLGRAIVREPKVMLLDEPLSNLDAKLRTQMRAEISKLHARLKTTFIYVTHDQVEAMTMGTRIVVMKNGFVQQIDTPKNLYNYPGNKFVAGFIGTPQMNFFEGTLLKKGEEVEIKFEYSDAKITVPYSMLYKARPAYLNGDRKVCIGLRAENLCVADKADKNAAVIKVKISHKEELGNQTLIYGDINMDGDGYSESSTRIIFEARGKTDFRTGEIVDVALDMNRVHLFDIETEESILPRIPEYNYVDCEAKGGKLSFLGNEVQLPPAINCKDCKGELLIPTDALAFGEGIEVNVVSCEEINGKNLVSFEVSGRRMFAVTAEQVKEGKAKVEIDLKRISVLSGGETVIESMPQTSCLNGKLLKEKVEETVEEKGRTKKKKVVKFFLGVEDAKLDAPDEITQKLITAIGVKRVLDEPLRYECGPYDFRFAEEGITAEVTEIADYGKEKFAVCKVGENTVYVLADEQVSGTVHILPDIEKLSIIQSKMDIRII